MFTLTWFPSESTRNPTFESTFSLERAVGPSTDMFVEYVGDYDHQRPSQVVDTGGAWRFTKTHNSIFTSDSGLTAVRSITTLVSAIHFASTDYWEDRLEIRRDLVLLGKVFAVALAVGLDVSAISVGVGVARLAVDASLRGPEEIKHLLN